MVLAAFFTLAFNFANAVAHTEPVTHARIAAVGILQKLAELIELEIISVFLRKL